MADLNVQPKRKGSLLPWLLLALGVLALLFFLSRGCNATNDATPVSDTSTRSSVPPTATGIAASSGVAIAACG